MKYVIELTGTPTPNGLIDIWGQIAVIDQGERLGTSKQRFLDRWFDSIQIGPNVHARKYSPRPESEEEITERISDIMVSMKSADYIELPPVVVVEHWVDLTEKQLKDYRRFEKDLAFRRTRHHRREQRRPHFQAAPIRQRERLPDRRGDGGARDDQHPRPQTRGT